jgi:hypothetical protein
MRRKWGTQWSLRVSFGIRRGRLGRVHDCRQNLTDARCGPVRTRLARVQPGGHGYDRDRWRQLTGLLHPDRVRYLIRHLTPGDVGSGGVRGDAMLDVYDTHAKEVRRVEDITEFHAYIDSLPKKPIGAERATPARRLPGDRSWTPGEDDLE